MKTRQELMLDFMLAMSPSVAEFVLNNEHISPQAICGECVLLASEMITQYLENT